jgi:1-deoxyxylulose-5-phosphate synthase
MNDKRRSENQRRPSSREFGRREFSRREFNHSLAAVGTSLFGTVLGCAPKQGSSPEASVSSAPISTEVASPTSDIANGASEASAIAPAVGSNPRAATGLVTLGKSGIQVPRLAMGTGSGGWARVSEQTRLGRDGFVRLMRHGAEQGARFLDVADLYGSHEYAKATLAEVPRDSMIVLSKVWFAAGAPKMEPTQTALPEVERFLRELGTDYLDIALVHCVEDPAWPRQQARMRDELSALKERGIVRAIGCSCHTHAALEVAANDPWVDVILARINPGRQRMDEDASVEQVMATLRRARANGKGVVGMKIYGAGRFNGPEQRLSSLRMALTQGLTDAITIGHASPEQFDDTVKNMERVLAG